MDPNRAIIALLQMRSDKLVSRDYVRREIPMDLNVTQEEQRVDIEEMRDSLRVAVAQYAQAIPALAAQGQDPSEIISRIASVIQGRQKGQSLESVIEKAFTPEPPPAQRCHLWLQVWSNSFQQQVRPPLLPRSNLHKNKLVRPLLLVKNPI
jgi:hypothetical protein